MTRRKFMISVVAACLYVFGPRTGLTDASASRHGRAKNKHLKQLIEQLFADTGSARAVGLSYLAMYPETARSAVDRTRNFLVSARHEQRDPAEKCLVRQRCDDFTEGRTIVIDGWVLARCEADLCAALVCLMDGQKPDVV